MKYGRIELFIDRVLSIVGKWMHPPRMIQLDLEDVDQDTLVLVEPTFVLSTGRCGTVWLTELLSKAPSTLVIHSEHPDLARHSRLSYESYEENPILFQEVLRAARDGYLLDTYRRKLTYIETNHRITFFAYAIRNVYPKARFVHLHRHPGDFVRSGLRRHWYSGSYYDVMRPRIQNETVWNAMSLIEKLAWLWNETNQYIEDFLATLNSSDLYLQVKAEDMWNRAEVTADICEFVSVKVSHRDIALMLERKVNRQRTGSMPPYRQWDNEQKEMVRRYAHLGVQYGYQV